MTKTAEAERETAGSAKQNAGGVNTGGRLLTQLATFALVAGTRGRMEAGKVVPPGQAGKRSAHT